MSTQINRSHVGVDDNGTGTTGTIVDVAYIDLAIYDQIDAMFANDVSFGGSVSAVDEVKWRLGATSTVFGRLTYDVAKDNVAYVSVNFNGVSQDDNTKSSWYVDLDSESDVTAIYRAAAGGSFTPHTRFLSDWSLQVVNNGVRANKFAMIDLYSGSSMYMRMVYYPTLANVGYMGINWDGQAQDNTSFPSWMWLFDGRTGGNAVDLQYVAAGGSASSVAKFEPTTSIFYGTVNVGNSAILKSTSANVLTMQNGGTSGAPVRQEFYVYGYNDGTNSEYGGLKHNGDGSVTLKVAKTGSGGQSTIYFNLAGSDRFVMNTSTGWFGTYSGYTLGINAYPWGAVYTNALYVKSSGSSVFAAGVSKTLGTNYQAQSDGLLVIKAEAASVTDTALLRIYTDATATPTTRIGSVSIDANFGIDEQSGCFLIRKSDYYRADTAASSGSPTLTATFYPIGA